MGGGGSGMVMHHRSISPGVRNSTPRGGEVPARTRTRSRTYSESSDGGGGDGGAARSHSPPAVVYTAVAEGTATPPAEMPPALANDDTPILSEEAIKYGLIAANDAVKSADRKLQKKPKVAVFGDNAAIEARLAAKGMPTK